MIDPRSSLKWDETKESSRCRKERGSAMSGFFNGEYHHTLDAKGRPSVPSRFRDILGTRFMIGEGLDECLIIYDMDSWREFEGKLKSLPTNTAEVRELIRYYESRTLEVEIDKQGRILLPQQLRTAGGLEKNVTFVGTGTRAELWDEETYELHKQKISKERISSIAANLLANGFQI